MINPINLGPECLSLKAVGQKVTREDLSPLDVPPEKPWLYQSSNAAVPVSTKPLGHQCSTMSLLHGGAMPVPRLHCCSFNEANILAEWQRSGLWRSKAVSSTPESCGPGTWLLLCYGLPAARGAMQELGLLSG